MTTDTAHSHDAPWKRALVEVQHALIADGEHPVASGERSPVVAGRAIGDAQATLRAALAKPRAYGMRSLLISHALAVLSAVRQVRRDHQGAAARLRPTLSTALGELLARFETYVLQGERTYEVRTADSGRCVDVAHTALELLDGDVTDRADVLLPGLDAAAVELAALLVRAAGNLATEGRPGDATYHCPSGVRRSLKDLVDEIHRASATLESSCPPGADVTAHSLAVALQVASRGPDGPEPDGPAPWASRAAWIQVAAHEYAAVRALDEQLARGDHKQFGDGLHGTLAAGAANVVCGARLLSRPEAFEIGAAWERQSAGITIANQEYASALEGDEAAFATTQLIVVTRLVRAVAALSLLNRGAGDAAVRQAPPVDRPSRRQRAVTANWLAEVRSERLGSPPV